MFTLGDFLSGEPLKSPSEFGFRVGSSEYAKAQTLYNSLLTNPKNTAGLQAKFTAEKSEYENLRPQTKTIPLKAPLRPSGQDILSSTRALTAARVQSAPVMEKEPPKEKSPVAMITALALGALAITALIPAAKGPKKRSMPLFE